MKEGRTWTVLEILQTTEKYFRDRGIDSPRLDAELLLAHVYGCRRIDLYTQFDRPLEAADLDGYRELVRKRASRMPVHYILGEREFYSRTFKVNKHVLIPRPETELLVERVIALVNEPAEQAQQTGEAVVEYFEPAMPQGPGEDEDAGLGDEAETVPQNDDSDEIETEHKKEEAQTFGNLSIADIGTGSGCIAITLAAELPGCRIWATDNNREALAVARINFETVESTSTIEWIESDLFSGFEAMLEHSFDFIVSNPPYIRESDYEGLMPEVRDFEPSQALLAGTDGLDFYRRLVAESSTWLKPGGWLVLEAGEGQAEKILEIANQKGGYGVHAITKDYAGIQRVVALQVG